MSFLNSPRPILLAAGFAAGAAIIAMPSLLRAKTYSKIARIASQTAKKIAKTSPQVILTTPLVGCLGAPQLCAEFDTVLRTELVKSIPDVQFIRREKAVKHLADHGFLGVDAYMGALDNVASDAGADVVVGEDFVRTLKGGCHLHTTVVDAKHHYALADISTGISCSAVPAETISLLKDPATGVSMIAPTPRGADTPPGGFPIKSPSCVSCPEPRYSGDARERGIQGVVRILITVTEQGTVENAKVVGAVEEGLALASLRAVSGWRLQPAVGLDGKPISVRTFVLVTFGLLQN